MIAIAIFVWIIFALLFIIPIYYGIYYNERRQKLSRALTILKELPLLHRAGMCETADIIVERAYEK